MEADIQQAAGAGQDEEGGPGRGVPHDGPALRQERASWKHMIMINLFNSGAPSSG